MPLISVIMSVYNGQDYLAEAVDSILNQTLRDFEFIIVDDGSTDRSRTMLETYAARDKRIRFIPGRNRGLTAALNECIRLSSGRYVARMDPDDVSRPERFEKQFEYLESHPDVVCLGSQVLLIDPFGTPLKQTNHPLTHGEIDRDLLRGIGWSIVHPAAMLRRETLIRIGGYNEAYRTSQDMELWLRLAEVGQLENLPDVLLDYRQHLASANFAKAEQQKTLKLQIMADAYARRNLGVFDPAVLQGAPMTDPWVSRKRWGWAAVEAGKMPAARSHAWTNIRQRPTSFEMWRMLLCSLKGG